MQQSKKNNLKIWGLKRKNKILLITNDTLVYGENPKETISSNNQTYQGHYIQSQHTKSIVFTCSSNKQLENKM